MSNDSADTGANDAYTIGAILQGAREASGESIDDVSRVLRINWRYLQALEEGQFDELPGTAYAIGFIRTYAEYLGINSADLVIQYKSLSETNRPKTSLEFPEPLPESGLPGGAILFAGIIVSILAYGGWYLATEEDSFLARIVSPVPDDMVSAIDQNPGDNTIAGDAAGAEQPTSQPAVVDVAEAITEQPLEEPATYTPPAEEPSDMVAESSPEPEAQPEAIVQEAVGVAESVEESVQKTEGAVEADLSETSLDTAQPTAVSEESPVIESAAIADAPDSVEKIEAVVEETVVHAPEPLSPETVSEPDVQETVAVHEDAVVEETVVRAPEPLSLETVSEPDVQETAVVHEDTDARALNEEQLLAVQATLVGDVPASAETTETEQAVVTEPIAEPAEGVASITEGTVEEPIVDTIEQTSDADAGVSNTAGENDQVAAIPVEEPVSEAVAGRVYGDEGDGRIVVRAKTNSWIQVRDDTTGQLLLTRLLRAGDEYHVPDRAGLSLLTGNAGALEILVDGAQVPAIGGTGDVRRNVVLDADRLMSGDAADN